MPAAEDARSSLSEQGRLVVVPDAKWTRVKYMLFNLFCILSNLLVGIIVYNLTKALTIELDFIALTCDALGVVINIGVEVLKATGEDLRSILMLDFVGCLLSLSLLVGVAIYGAIDASTHGSRVEQGETHVEHLSYMLAYSSFSMVLSALSISVFVYSKDRIAPSHGNIHDQLNMLSNFTHSIIGGVTSFAVLVTSLWLAREEEIVKRHWWWSIRMINEKESYIDVVGSCMVLLTIGFAVVYLGRDALQSYRVLKSLSEAKEGSTTADILGDSSNYGTLKEA